MFDRQLSIGIYNKKLIGQVYTPDFVVNNILDMVGYKGDNLFQKHIIDNSCGDGAFLRKIIKRYCDFAILYKNITANELKNHLETFIHGIEIDKEEVNKCINNLNQIVVNYNIYNVNWDIRIANTLIIAQNYYGEMDFVVGNPPYIRVHNLDKFFYNSIKNYHFSQSGMTDVYIVFFEIGIRMLNNNGRLGYITPSSYFNSLAGKSLRYYLIDFNLISKIVDLKHYQCFTATTYTAITILEKNRQHDEIEYYEYDEDNKREMFVETLSKNDFFISDNFYFGKKNDLKELLNILTYTSKKSVEIKNGFATLCDKFFIAKEFPFDEFIIPIIKASTGKIAKCFFPYKNGIVVDYDSFNINIKNYYKKYETILRSRSLEKKNIWWGFGRSQGINDVFKDKISINSLLKTTKDIKLMECKSGTAVYGGLYILGDYDFKVIKDILMNDNFIKYISMLGKYKNGGYYTFSSKDLSLYLNYQLSKIKI